MSGTLLLFAQWVASSSPWILDDPHRRAALPSHELPWGPRNTRRNHRSQGRKMREKPPMLLAPTIHQRSTFTARPFSASGETVREGRPGHSKLTHGLVRRRRATSPSDRDRRARWGRARMGRNEMHSRCQQQGTYGHADRQRRRCVRVLFGLLSPRAPTLVQRPPSARPRRSISPMSTERDVVACQR